MGPDPPPPHFGTLASSGGSPAAFILICFLCGNCVGHFDLLTPTLGPLPIWPGTHIPRLLCPLSPTMSVAGPRGESGCFQGYTNTYWGVLSPVLGVKFNGRGGGGGPEEEISLRTSNWFFPLPPILSPVTVSQCQGPAKFLGNRVPVPFAPTHC